MENNESFASPKEETKEEEFLMHHTCEHCGFECQCSDQPCSCCQEETPASKEKPDFYSLLSSLVTTYQQDIEDWGIDTDKLPRKALKTIVDKIDYQNECLKTLAVGLRASYELKIAALQEEIRQLKEHSEETFKMVENAVVSGNYDTTTGENLELLSIHLRQLKNKQ